MKLKKSTKSSSRRNHQKSSKTTSRVFFKDFPNIKRPNMKRIFFILAAISVAVTSCSQTKDRNTTGQRNAAVVTGSTAKSANGKSDGNGKVNYLTTDDFKTLIMDYKEHPQEWVYKGKRPAVVDFYATWCGPCKLMSPIVEEVAKSYNGEVNFYKVDVDKEKELASVFGIQSIPTFLFIPEKGTPTVQMGAMEKAEFEELVKSTIAK